jgi:GalNAc-alpha-(1->4)-GalNAc-alpha-(1->3)-diNAcBac-PP-undecaprenol alpha-1,4-N-acetyl-D-galactosaminyltransferase
LAAQQRISLLIVLSQLRMGGAERAALKLAKSLSQRAYDIKIITFTQDEDFYELPEAIKRIQLDLARPAPTILHTLYNTVLRVWGLRKAILAEKPNVVLTMLPINDILTSLALFGTGIPQVISTRVYPSIYSERRALSLMKRILYPLAKFIVSVSTGVDQAYSWIDASKRTVIGNSPSIVSADDMEVEAAFQMPADKHYIVSVGRFVPDKNFALLVDSFGKIAVQNPDWNLMIIGDGAQKDALAKQASDLGIAARVFLPGRTQKPFPVLKAANIFVLPSDYEGVPNVVLEAMACGLPVITTDYYGEPRDIICHDENGLIVPRSDAQAMADAMQRLIDDEELARKLAQNGLKYVKNIDTQKLIAAWDEVFQKSIR